MIEARYRKVSDVGSCNAHVTDYPYDPSLLVWQIVLSAGVGGGTEIRLCESCLRDLPRPSK